MRAFLALCALGVALGVPQNVYDGPAGGAWKVKASWRTGELPKYPEQVTLPREVQILAGGAPSAGKDIVVNDHLIITSDLDIGPTTCDPATQTQTAPATSTSDTQCACKLAHFHMVNNGRQCEQNQCTCTNGDAKSGAQCLSHNAHHCETCDQWHHIDGNVCAKNECKCQDGEPVSFDSCAADQTSNCASCSPGFHLEADDGNTQKCEHNQCHCDHGQNQVGAACHTHLQEICTDQCDAGYHLEGEVCVINVCSCSNGAAKDANPSESSSYCQQHGAEECKTCDATYHMEGDKCEENVCKCENGTPVVHAECAVHESNTCKTCSATWHLNAKSNCERNQCYCNNGLEVASDDCMSHKDHHCHVDGCQTGFHHKDKKCVENVCTCSHGDVAEGTDCYKHEEEICPGACDESYHAEVINGHRVCVRNICHCNNGGTAKEGFDCKTHGMLSCSACMGDFWLNGPMCSPWQLCNEGETYESVRPSNTNNRECMTVRECDQLTHYESRAPTLLTDRACSRRIDCGLKEWGSWDKCDQNCHKSGQPFGRQTRTRDVHTQSDNSHEKTCGIESADTHNMEVRQCNTFCCGTSYDQSVGDAAKFAVTHSSTRLSPTMVLEEVTLLPNTPGHSPSEVCQARPGFSLCSVDDGNQVKSSIGNVIKCCGERNTQLQTCLDCQAGRASSFLGIGQCPVCPKGSWAGEKSGKCEDCDAGRFGPSEESALRSDCQACAAGKFSLNGAPECTYCGDGHVSAPESSSSAACEPCAAGHFSATPQSACEKCHYGDFMASTGAAACDECIAGKYTGAKRGLKYESDCKDCDYGEWSEKSSEVCAVCDAGRYNENRAHGLWPSAPACKACAKGKFAGSKSTKLCEDCPAGHFMTGQAATECQPCKAGYYNPSEGQSAAHDDSCIPCPKGAYCPEGSAAFIKCNPGFQQPILYATKESDCKKCEKGTYAGTAQTETCEECGAGYYQDQEAKDDCKECPAGTAQPLDKRTLLSECESCHLGKYQPHKARSFCLNCSQGRYQDEKKQLSCKGCPSGQFGLKKDDGKDHMRIGLTEGCEECGFGKYQEQEGKNGCTECDVGTASAEIGAHDRVVCKTCEAGQFADSPATKTCKLCKPGRHGPTDNTQVHDEDLHCIHCPHGHYQEKDGSTKCEVCEAGKFTGVEHCNSDKSKCTFTATTGHATCVDCPQVDALRTWTSDAGANSCRKDPVPAEYSPWTEYLHPNGYTDHATGTCSIKCQNDGGWDDGVYVPRTEPGYQTKTRVPVDPGADNGVTCGLDEKAHCLWSWGFDGPLSDKPNYDSLSETRRCNHGEDEGDYTGVGYCPRDCTVTEWLPWSTCTQSCGTGGMTYRQRHVKHPAAHGGSCDKHFDEDAECNRVSCKAPYCHDKHVQCKVQTKNFGLGCSNIFGCGAHDVDGINADGLATPRCNTWHNHRLNCHLDSTAQDEASGVQANWKQIEKTDENSWTASEKCDNDRTCHMCSSEAECALKGMHQTIVVTHNRKYMCSTYGKECNRPNSGEHSAAYEEDEIEQLTDAFHCERVCKNGDSFEEIIHARLTKTHANEKYTSKYMLPKESRAECQFCKCRCKKHPPCYGKTGQDLSNTIILGNHWQLIAKRQDCCNMCTNHPQCGSFTYEADGGHCKLYTGTAVFKASDNAGIFAGCKFGDKCGTEQVTASVMA